MCRKEHEGQVVRRSELSRWLTLHKGRPRANRAKSSSKPQLAPECGQLQAKFFSWKWFLKAKNLTFAYLILFLNWLDLIVLMSK